MQAAAPKMSNGSKFSEIFETYKALSPFFTSFYHHSRTSITGKILIQE
jgi:hypothetical protein